MKYRLIGKNDYLLNPKETILKNRGIDDISTFLNLNKSVIYDDKLLVNLDKAVQRFIKHLNNNSTIFIQVDGDTDGYTSSALLYNYIKLLNKDINIIYRLHEGKEHGIYANTVPEGVDLVIVPDAGSNDYEQHAFLVNRDIEVIVLDHHECDFYSEDAIVVNSKMGKYPNRELSGVGVVYKFCKAVDKALGVNYADDFLDLVAVGNIGDMVDTRSLETRYLIMEGLKNIKNPFIKALIDKQAYSMKNEVNMLTIAFYICPLINASVRIGTKEEKEAIFKSFIDFETTVKYKKRGSTEEEDIPLAEDTARVCVNIKAKQDRSRDKGLELITTRIEEKELNKNKVLIVNCSEILEQNLTGLVANQLAGKYKKPVILLKKFKEDLFGGSARGYDKSELKDFRQFVVNTELFKLAQGHANAFGIQIEKDKVVEACELMNVRLADIDFDDIYDVDFIIPANQLTSAIVTEIDDMKAIWGQGCPEPLVLITGLEVSLSEKDNLKGKSLNTVIFESRGIKFIKFNYENTDGLLTNGGKNVIIDIVGRFTMNEWEGKKSPQVIIEDYNFKVSDKSSFLF